MHAGKPCLSSLSLYVMSLWPWGYFFRGMTIYFHMLAHFWQVRNVWHCIIHRLCRSTAGNNAVSSAEMHSLLLALVVSDWILQFRGKLQFQHPRNWQVFIINPLTAVLQNVTANRHRSDCKRFPFETDGCLHSIFQSWKMWCRSLYFWL